jgi:hypothetical protein
MASLEQEAEQWTKDTSSFIEKNLGAAARDRFLDISNMPIYGWTISHQTQETIQEYNGLMNTLANRRKNLSLLIETAAYDR